MVGAGDFTAEGGIMGSRAETYRRTFIWRWAWLWLPCALAALGCDCDAMRAAGVCEPGAFRCAEAGAGEVALEACDCGRRGGEITGCRYPPKWVKATGLCAPGQQCVERSDGKAAACIETMGGPCTWGLATERCLDSQTALQCVQFIGPPIVNAGENQPGILSEVTCEPGFSCQLEERFAVCVLP